MSSVVLSPPEGASSWQKVDGKWKTVVCQVKPVAVPGRPDRDLDFEVNRIVIPNCKDKAYCSIKYLVKYVEYKICTKKVKTKILKTDYTC